MAGYQLGVGMNARSQLASDRKTQFVVRSLGDSAPLERSRYLATFRPVEEAFGETINRLVQGGLVTNHTVTTIPFCPRRFRQPMRRILLS